jgi:hypothetical protein
MQISTVKQDPFYISSKPDTKRNVEVEASALVRST